METSFIFAWGLVDLPALWVQTFYFVVAPMLLLIGLGYGIQRQMELDIPSLVRLNFYYVVPAIIYYSIVSSRISLADVGLVVGFHVLLMLLLAGGTVLVAKMRGVAPDRINAMLMSVIFYNSANYGLPLQDLAYRAVGRSGEAMGLQVFVMLLQNVFSFTLGVFLAAVGGGGSRHWKQIASHILKFPPLYALLAGLVTVQIRRSLGDQSVEVARWLTPFWEAMVHIKSAFVAIALLTLGAQLATLPAKVQDRYPVVLSLLLRLLLAPMLALGLIYGAHLCRPGWIDPFVAQVLLISSSVPTALNAMLLCLEFDNHPDYLARVVFYATLFSPVTVTLVIFMAQSGWFAPLTATAG